MRGQLLAVEGVLKAEVDFKAKTAKVTVAKGTSPEKVVSGLSGKYSGTVK